MSVSNLGPLDWRIPIVTEDGRPTQEFQRRWASQISNNNLIGEGVLLGSGPPPAVPAPEDGNQYVDISTTPYTLYIANGGVWGLAGAGSANPTAVAKDTVINGTASTFMRSDAAPAVQKASSSQFGIVKVDGTTITETGGVISATGGSGGGFTALALPTAAPGASGSAFASKGFRFSRGLRPLTLSSVVPTNTWVNAFNYYCVVGVANSSGVITSITGTTSARTGITAGVSRQEFVFPAPIVLNPSTLAAGSDFFALLVCTNGTGGGAYTLPLTSSATGASLSGTFWQRFSDVRVASTAPALGQTLDLWSTAPSNWWLSFFGVEA